MAAPRTDIRYSTTIGNINAYITGVDFNIRPHRLYLTAERALNKDEFAQVLWWNTEYHRIFPNIPKGSNYKIDERGEVVKISTGSYGYEPGVGWLRVDELNAPLNVVPLKYYTPQKRDVGRLWRDVAEVQGLSSLHGDQSIYELIKMWNRPKHYILNSKIGSSDVGKTYIIDMGFPPTSDANLFSNE